MLSQKENHKAKKRLTKVIRRLFLQNKRLSPKALLNSTIQTQDGHVRFWKGFSSLLLIALGIYLFLGMDLGILVALFIIPIGILVLRDAWTGDKKRVRDYLRELVDFTCNLEDALATQKPEKRAEIRKKILAFHNLVDYWAIDWNYGKLKASSGDGTPILRNQSQAFRTEETPELPLKMFSENHPLGNQIAVSVTDIFGNTCLRVMEKTEKGWKTA